MPFGRRRYAKQVTREMEREEQRRREVARIAVSRVVCCFTSDPDEYDVRCSIVFRPPEEDDTPPDAPRLMVAQLVWKDDDRNDYFMSEDPWFVVRELLPAASESDGRQLAASWVGATSDERPFDFIPCLYQYAYVRLCTGDAPPSIGIEYMWFLPGASPHDEVLVMRPLPSGIGEHGPPVGEVAFMHMQRAGVAELLATRW